MAATREQEQQEQQRDSDTEKFKQKTAQQSLYEIQAKQAASFARDLEELAVRFATRFDGAMCQVAFGLFGPTPAILGHPPSRLGKDTTKREPLPTPHEHLCAFLA